jgi:hypothetical protein
MLISDLVLRAVKKLNLVDATVDSLTIAEKNQYAYACQEAISNFNNDPSISIGTEQVMITEWIADPKLGFFARIVRDDTLNNQHRIGEPSPRQTNDSLARLGEHSPAYSVQEIPIRIVSAVGNPGGVLVNTPSNNQSVNRTGLMITDGGSPSGVMKWDIVNEIEFSQSPVNSRVVCMTRRENEALIRIKTPAPMLVVFDRAIYFPYNTTPGEATLNGQTIDPLDVNIDIPTNHLSYLCNLIALEIGQENNLDAGQIKSVSDMLNRQRNSLMQSNVRDRVKVPHTDFDYVYNLMNRRAWR